MKGMEKNSQCLYGAVNAKLVFFSHIRIEIIHVEYAVYSVTHGVGLHIRILYLVDALYKIIEYKDARYKIIEYKGPSRV